MSVLIDLTLVLIGACPTHHVGDLIVAQASDVPPCLETIDGKLSVATRDSIITFPRLTDVTGHVTLTLTGRGRAHFPALERVHDGLEVVLKATGDLNFPKLSHVGGPLGLDLDPSASARGFENLVRHSGGLWIFGGGDLSDVLPNLWIVSGTVFIQPTGPVKHLLPKLTHVGGHLVMRNTPHFPLKGLSGLSDIDGGVYLFGGDEFILPGIRRVGGPLAIRDSMAKNLASFGIEGARVGALLLRDNPQLSTWPRHLVVPENRVLSDNNPQLEPPPDHRSSAQETPKKPVPETSPPRGAHQHPPRSAWD